MWAVLWRPVVGLLGLGVAGAGTLAAIEKWSDPLWLTLLNAGGWFLIGVLAIVSLGLLVAGAWPVVRLVLGADDQPWKHARRFKPH